MNAGDPGYSAYRTFTPLLDSHSLPRGAVLAIAPHPDDEIIGCGGTLAFHSSRGDRVTVVHMTGGERGDPSGFVAGDLVRTRQSESEEAAKELGIHEVLSLGFPDGALATDESTVARLLQEIHRVAPVIVYAPSPLECHPDHLATCWVTAKALRECALLVRLCMYEVNHPTLASWLLDVTPYIDRKRDALSRFKSQQRYQDVVGKSLAGAYARTVNVDLPEIQYAEAFLELDAKALPEVWKDLQRLCELMQRRRSPT